MRGNDVGGVRVCANDLLSSVELRTSRIHTSICGISSWGTLPGLCCWVCKPASLVHQCVTNHKSFSGNVVLLQSKIIWFGYSNETTLCCFLVCDKSWSLRVVTRVSPFKWWLSLLLLILYLQIFLMFFASFRYPLICFGPEHWNFLIIVGSQRKLGFFSWEDFSWSAWDWSGNVNIDHTKFRKSESDNKKTYLDTSLFFNLMFCVILSSTVSLFVQWVIPAIVKISFFFFLFLEVLLQPIAYFVRSSSVLSVSSF